MDEDGYIRIEEVDVKPKDPHSPMLPVEQAKTDFKQLNDYKVQDEPLKLSPEEKFKEVQRFNKDPAVINNNLILVDKSIVRRGYVIIAILGILLLVQLIWFNFNFASKEAVTNIPVNNDNVNNFTIINTPQNPNINYNPNNSYTIYVTTNLTISNPQFRIYPNSSQ